MQSIDQPSAKPWKTSSGDLGPRNRVTREQERVPSCSELQAGVVGLGLMGSGIVAALLMAGHQVRAIAPLPDDEDSAPSRIRDQLEQCAEMGLLSCSTDECLDRLLISTDYNQLQGCAFVLECVVEQEEIKVAVYKKITAAVDRETIIGSNTSAIPISVLQKNVPGPERFMGIHWAEPAYATRFLEITCGEQTLIHHAKWIASLAHSWRKEPTILRKDIRGFITNRLMYAVYREALHLIEENKATLQDVDKAFRYDAGSWITIMGVFRRMDYMGLLDYQEIMSRFFPQLSNRKAVPATAWKMVETQAKGIRDLNGFYSYTSAEAVAWQEAFARFNQDIYELAAWYPDQKP